MASDRRDRIMGVETEFGCLVSDPSWGTPEQAVEAIKNHVFYEQGLGAIDLHARDEVFEPARSGGFLLNGGRLYIDAVGSHLEYASAECRTIRDLIANDRAGQRIVTRAVDELGLSDQVAFYNNSVDHFGGHTFGCHENYLVRMEEDFYSRRIDGILAFLVTRQIFAGVGRVGGHVLTSTGGRPSYEEVAANPIDFVWVSQVYNVLPDPTVEFQLSQRADHILKTIGSRVRFNRALVNPRWEHFYSHDSMQRLHLLFGESNQMEYAYALKVGTTSLVLRLAEEGLIPSSLQAAQPLVALREVSRDPTFRWPVLLVTGEVVGAVEVQRRYLELAREFRGESDQTDWILSEWKATLDALERDPMELSDRLDWVAKLKIVREYREDRGLDAFDDALHSVDLEYHNIDPSKSLYGALVEMGRAIRMVDDVDILEAMTTPPPDTRAKARADLVQRILARQRAGFYMVDWNGVALDRQTYHDLSDPYESRVPS